MTAKTNIPPCPVDTRFCPCCRSTTVRHGLSMRGELYLVSARCTTCDSTHSMSVGRDDNATLAETVRELFREWTDKVTMEKRVFYAMEACMRQVAAERNSAKEAFGAKDSVSLACVAHKYNTKQAIRILTAAVNHGEPAKCIVTNNLGSIDNSDVGLFPNASYYQLLMRSIGFILCEIEKLAQAGEFDDDYVAAVCPQSCVPRAPSTPENIVSEACRFMRARYGLATNDPDDAEDD